jgi:hypothetical protein
VEAHRKELAHKHEAELKAAKLEAVRELALRTLKEAPACGALRWSTRSGRHCTSLSAS